MGYMPERDRRGRNYRREDRRVKEPEGKDGWILRGEGRQEKRVKEMSEQRRKESRCIDYYGRCNGEWSVGRNDVKGMRGGPKYGLLTAVVSFSVATLFFAMKFH